MDQQEAEEAIVLGDYREKLPPKESCWIVTDPPYNIGFKYPGYEDMLHHDDYAELFRPMVGYRVVMIIYPEELFNHVIPVLGPPPRGRCMGVQLQLAEAMAHDSVVQLHA